MASKVQVKVKPQKKTQVASVVQESIFKDVKKTGKDVLQFTIAPTHVSYANSLRRAILTMVESVGFNADIEEGTGATTNVKILKNNTPMSNEMLAHRIGLLPVHVAAPLKWNEEDFIFKLHLKNDEFASKDITADLIKVYKKPLTPEEEPEEVPSSTFFHPHPITKSTALLGVLKGKVGSQASDEVECVMKATLGNGKQNARFIPTSQCSYKYTIDPNPERRKEVYNAWLSSSKKVNHADLESNPQRKGELEREFATMEAMRCFLQENNEPYSFDFTVESVGVLAPGYIVARALDVLQSRCLKYASINVSDLPDGLTVAPADFEGIGYDFLFQGEDHTMGNLLDTYIAENLVGDEVSFVGYKVPHPLRDEMLLRVGVEKDGQQITARAAVARAAKACADMFGKWRAEWEVYSNQ
jgi:DNA-directed RNA polymerase subunit L